MSAITDFDGIEVAGVPVVRATRRGLLADVVAMTREPSGDWLPDEIILDAAPFQILGERHVAALPRRAREAVRSLDGHRFALALGDVGDWLLSDARRRDRARRQGRRVVGSLMTTAKKAADRFVRLQREALASDDRRP